MTISPEELARMLFAEQQLRKAAEVALAQAQRDNAALRAALSEARTIFGAGDGPDTAAWLKRIDALLEKWT